MSFRAQAHCGPLPNEPTSQGWISATSITVGQLWALIVCARYFGGGPSRTPSRHVGLRWAGLVGLGWLGVLYRVRTYTALTKLKGRGRCCCVRRVCSRDVGVKRSALPRSGEPADPGQALEQPPPCWGPPHPAATGRRQHKHIPDPWLLSGPAPPKAAQPLATLSQSQNAVYCVLWRAGSSSFVSPARTSPRLSTDILLLSSSQVSRVGLRHELCADTPRLTSIFSSQAAEHGSIVDTQRRLLENRAKDVTQNFQNNIQAKLGMERRSAV